MSTALTISVVQKGAPAAADPLSQLRDIHPPPPPSWWPPAPGWWILALLLLALLAAGCWWGWQRLEQRRRSARIEAMARAEFASWQQHGDANRLASGLNALLKRAALAAFPRRDTASLSGAAWLAFLDQHAPGTGAGEPPARQPFSNGVGSVLATLPYGGTADVNFDGVALTELVCCWLRHVSRQHPAR